MSTLLQFPLLWLFDVIRMKDYMETQNFTLYLQPPKSINEKSTALISQSLIPVADLKEEV